jgi:hypothetical protein
MEKACKDCYYFSYSLVCQNEKCRGGITPDHVGCIHFNEKQWKCASCEHFDKKDKWCRMQECGTIEDSLCAEFTRA